MKLRRHRADEAKPMELPCAGTTVMVSTPAGGHIPARVLERGASSLTIAALVPIKPFSAAQLEALQIEYAELRGRVRLCGAAAVVDPAEPGVLCIEDPRSVEVLQQREYVRIQAARPVVVYRSGDAMEVQSYTIDVSGGGFLLAGPETLKPGSEVSFRLSVDKGGTPIRGKGRVVRADDFGRLAVVFSEIADADRSRLVHFIFECQRLERRRGLETGGHHG
ncbi:MAG TPA: PilZ domain-containing protein [Solirubrobacteraceae bacterium]|nr:PilZ domain-containing protein [Solirubrobacteraceae bacterium]